MLDRKYFIFTGKARAFENGIQVTVIILRCVITVFPLCPYEKLNKTDVPISSYLIAPSSNITAAFSFSADIALLLRITVRTEITKE